MRKSSDLIRPAGLRGSVERIRSAKLELRRAYSLYINTIDKRVSSGFALASLTLFANVMLDFLCNDKNTCWLTSRDLRSH